MCERPGYRTVFGVAVFGVAYQWGKIQRNREKDKYLRLQEAEQNAKYSQLEHQIKSLTDTNAALTEQLDAARGLRRPVVVETPVAAAVDEDDLIGLWIETSEKAMAGKPAKAAAGGAHH